MVNNPIRLQDNFYLYSGDIITIDNNNPLLVEVINDQDQTIKLRSVKDNKYLKENKKLSLSKFSFKSKLKFSADFNDALVFTIKKDDHGKISLQTSDSKYLELNNNTFHLSSEGKWLNVDKQKDVEDIADFKETMKIISFSKEKENKINDGEEVIARKSYNNKRKETLKYNFEFTEEKQVEHSFTWTTDSTWGVSGGLKLDCHGIVGLEIGGTFEKNSGTSNGITKTEKKSFKESFEVDCAPWKETRVKLIAKKVKLFTPYTANIKRTISGRPYEYLIDGQYFSASYSESRCLAEEITVRNILLVGWTGSGKSTLANVLSSSKDFVESNQSMPETKWGKTSNEFEWKGNYYCVIDNIGFGDTEVSEKQELIRIGKAISEVSQGLSHVLFTYKRRFSDKEKESFGKLNALKITESLITIVRTNFDNFKSKERCENDVKLLKEEGSEIKQTINSCRGLLYVNNNNDKNRNTSREIVLDHLHDSCERNPFKPEEWERIEDIKTLIENYFAEKEKLEKEKDQVDDIQKGEINQQIDNLETNTAEQVKEKIQETEVYRLAQIIQEAK